jgi:hypothetical protein
VSTSQAVALGLLIYIVNVAVSLIGVPAFAMGADGQSVSVSSE